MQANNRNHNSIFKIAATMRKLVHNPKFIFTFTLLVAILTIFAATVAVLQPMLTNYSKYHHFNLDEMIMVFLCGFAYCLLLIITLKLSQSIVKKKRAASVTHSIFLSYAKEDSKLALEIATELNSCFSQILNCGLRIKTIKDIPYGANITTETETYLEESSIVIAIVTEDYVKNMACKDEYISFLDAKKRVVPIVIDSDESRVCEKLLPELSQTHYLLLDKTKMSKPDSAWTYLEHVLYLLANQLAS